MKILINLAVIVSLIATLTGCDNRTSETESDFTKITNVEIYTVELTSFEKYINLPVFVTPYKEVNFGLTAGGRITKIHVDKGDRVSKDMILLETDDVLLKASFDIAKAGLEYQKKEFERNEKLFEEGSITAAAYDGAKFQLSQAQSSYDIAKKQYEDATLKAPFSGIVTSRSVEVGDILAPGSPAFRIIDVQRIKVQAGIPEKHIMDFKKGNTVKIVFDTIPDDEFTGRINYIAPEASPDVRTFLAEIIVDNRDGFIRAGIMGNAQLLKKVYKDALMIPINAMIQTQEGQIVFIVEGSTTAAERSIELGPKSELMVMVKSGLIPGDKVVIKGQHDLVDGEKLNITGTSTFAYGEVSK